MALMDHLLVNHPMLGDDERVHFHVRGDASFVLMELVQHSLINHFELANGRLLGNSNGTRKITRLQTRVVTLSLTSKNTSNTQGFKHSHRIGGIMTGSQVEALDSAVNSSIALIDMDQFPQLIMAVIEKMMRRISLRAGVARLSHGLYSHAWDNVIGTIMAIVTPAQQQSLKLYAYRREYNKKAFVMWLLSLLRP
jgi:hypothetical protein